MNPRPRRMAARPVHRRALVPAVGAAGPDRAWRRAVSPAVLRANVAVTVPVARIELIRSGLQVMPNRLPSMLLCAQRHPVRAGITGLLVGPADLAVASGLPGQTGHERILRSTELVHAAAHRAGCAVMVIVGSPRAASYAFAGGAQLVLCNVAQALNEVFAGLVATRPSTGAAPSGAHRGGDKSATA
jgi:hypothetical protein